MAGHLTLTMATAASFACSLSNLHNLLPASSALRRPTISALIDVASSHGELSAVGISPSLVKTWIGEWADVGEADKAAFVEKVAEAVATKNECVWSWATPASDAGG